MEINTLKTKNNFHNYITIKQADNTSFIELLLCGNDGSQLINLNTTCTVTLLDTVDNQIRQKSTEKIVGGLLAFKVKNVLKANKHNLEVTLSDGSKYPSDGDFTVLVSKSHTDRELEIINTMTYDDAVKKLAENIVTDFVEEKFYKMSSERQNMAEVIQARGMNATLKDEIKRVDTKLYTKPSNDLRPMVGFYLDDGYQNDYDIVFPKAKLLGIPLTICLFNTSALVSTPDRLHELIENGWELHSHTATHADLNTLTLDQQRKEMADSIKFFKEKFNYLLKGICYPKGYTNAETLRAAREYFEVGMSSIPGINGSPNDTYFINRDLTDAVDLNVIKAKVDKIKADGKGFLIIYSHSNIFNSNTAVRDRYFEMMDYVAASGVETATVSDIMKVYKNTLDIGDIKYSENYLKTGADGNIASNLLPFKIDSKVSKVNDRPADEYEKGKVTVTSFKLGAGSDIPFDGGIGTLYTDRTFEASALPRATQKFEGFDGTIVTRKFLSGAWTEWQKAGDLNLLNNQYKNDTPISSYPVKKVTKTTHISTDNTSFPDNAIGTLETNRLSTNDILNYQMFYPYNKNVFFKRFWTASGWGEWQKFSPTLSGKMTYDFGTLNAGSTKTTTVTIAGVVFDDVPSVNVQYGIANGIIVSCYVSAVNTVTIKIFNPTSINILVGARTFNVAVLKN